MYGFYGRFLKVDLTDRTYDIVTLPDSVLLKYLGGKGLLIQQDLTPLSSRAKTNVRP